MAVTPEAREGGERRVAERDEAQSAAPTKSKTDRLTLGTIAEFAMEGGSSGRLKPRGLDSKKCKKWKIF